MWPVDFAKLTKVVWLCLGSVDFYDNEVIPRTKSYPPSPQLRPVFAKASTDRRGYGGQAPRKRVTREINESAGSPFKAGDDVKNSGLPVGLSTVATKAKAGDDIRRSIDPKLRIKILIPAFYY